MVFEIREWRSRYFSRYIFDVNGPPPPPKGWRPNNINTTQMNETRPTDCMETCLAGRTVSTRTPVGRRWRLCGVSVSCCRPCGREGNRRSVVVRHRRAAAVRVRRSRVGGTVERRQALPLARHTPQRHGRDGRRGGSTSGTAGLGRDGRRGGRVTSQ